LGGYPQNEEKLPWIEKFRYGETAPATDRHTSEGTENKKVNGPAEKPLMTKGGSLPARLRRGIWNGLS